MEQYQVLNSVILMVPTPEAGNDTPKFADEDLKAIGSPLDFVGINVYCPMAYVVASDQAPGWRNVPFAKGHAKAAINHFPIGPECLYWAPKFVQSLWGAKEIFITENGCADDDAIYDTDRNRSNVRPRRDVPSGPLASVPSDRSMNKNFTFALAVAFGLRLCIGLMLNQTPAARAPSDKAAAPGRYTVVDTEATILLVTDNNRNTLYFYSVDCDQPAGSDLNCEGRWT